jgi:hypothetical protein
MTIGLSETCGYRSNPDLQPNEFCGKTKEEHRYLLHSFIPSNIVMIHVTGTQGPQKCMRCGMIWFLKEDNFATCVSCTQRYEMIKFPEVGG